ncbi:MAG: hypothetical protein ACRDPQ_13530 [Nocardioidaceae bacterium]
MSDASTRWRLPGDAERLRCSGCGNLTRFDVTRTRRTREFWHVALSGDADVEDDTVLDEEVESVRCRWCGRADAIEVVARADADLVADPAAESA